MRPQRPGVSDLDVLGFAGDAASDRRSATKCCTCGRCPRRRFDTSGHAAALVNAPDNLDAHRYAPMATYDNLYDSLARIGALMDRDEDILLLFASTHGTEDHTLYVDAGPNGYDYITPKTCSQGPGRCWHRASRHRAVGVLPQAASFHACGLPDTLVITAARADRPSFGCGNTANATYFGQPALVEADEPDR